MNWFETYAKTHLFYIILIVGGVFSFNVWLQEHDAKVVAQLTVKQQQSVIADLKQQEAATQAQAAQKVQVVKTVVEKAVTPSQVIAAIPTLTDVPLAPQLLPDDPSSVKVAAQPLAQLAGDDKTANIQLAACQQVNDLKDKQLDAQNVEIKALKKKPRWYVRVKHVAEAVGVGVAVGFVLAKR